MTHDQSNNQSVADDLALILRYAESAATAVRHAVDQHARGNTAAVVAALQQTKLPLATASALVALVAVSIKHHQPPHHARGNHDDGTSGTAADALGFATDRAMGAHGKRARRVADRSGP